MLDNKTQRLMNNCNRIWKIIAETLDDESMGYDDCANMMLTLNARYLNGIRKLESDDAEGKEMIFQLKKMINNEYIKLLEEKLG